ncbi:ABC transporter substrate-binding protein [Glaciibacter psychrotolerans]|uniref:Polar amino acid transport system substrate-binding protein n=1 Tax=Glaciibacter psychrotolerans TaxID=670054 RepID=A0A7Z0EDP4_9MICO|nr:ABC transporter substrate-binding protein [Leifsonia psychrotolerans]NYJ19737.1 polar amino acid transport system substrate-binding protein [Leifsonia psychrotolerans]
MTTKSTSVSWKLATAIGVTASLLLAGCSAGGAGGSTAAATANPADLDPAAAAALPAKFKDAGVIKVASDIPFPPMEMFDANQNLTGFDFDLAQVLGGKLGVRMELQTQAFDSIIPSLQSGKHDVIMSGMNDTPERQKTLDFVAYLHAGFSILVLAGNPDGITTVLDLCGKDVTVQKATVQADILHGYDAQCTAAGPGPIKTMELPIETDVQTAVRSGKAVADVVDSVVAAYASQTAGDGKLFDVVKDPENPAGYNPVYTGIGVLKKDNALAKALNLAMESAIADGSYARVLKKYDMVDYGIPQAGINLGS